MAKPLHLQHTHDYKVRLNEQDYSDLESLAQLTGISPAVLSRNAVKEMLNRARANSNVASKKPSLSIVPSQDLIGRG